jgi:hypothetical protein
MIKFFRKIRQNMIKENRASKYILYAIGEIVLVVIGILIALSINNWNEENKDRVLEKQMMANLNTEFQNNLDKIQKSVSQYKQTEDAIRFLMSKMKASSEELNQYNIDSLLAVAVDVFDYRPTQNTLTEILSSGNLKLISNDSIKFNLLQWSAELNEINEAWLTLDDFNQNMVFPYLTENVSMKNIDKYSLMKWEDKSKFNVDYAETFNDIIFENNLDNLGWAVVNYQMVLTRLEKVIKNIIRLTHSQ